MFLMSWNLNVIRWYSNLFPFIFGWVSLCLWVNPDHIMLLFRYIIKGPEYSEREIDKLEWLEMMLNYRLKTIFKRNSIDIELYLQSWLYCISLTVSLKFNGHGCTILVDFQAWIVYFNFCVFFLSYDIIPSFSISTFLSSTEATTWLGSVFDLWAV